MGNVCLLGHLSVCKYLIHLPVCLDLHTCFKNAFDVFMVILAYQIMCMVTNTLGATITLIDK